MAVEIGREWDGCGFSRGDRDALVRLGVYCVGLSASEDGKCLGGRAPVGNVNTGAAALVGCGSRLEERFQRARDPGGGVFYRGRRGKSRLDGARENETEGEGGSKRSGRFERHSEGRASKNKDPKKEREVRESDWTCLQRVTRQERYEERKPILMYGPGRAWIAKEHSITPRLVWLARQASNSREEISRLCFAKPTGGRVSESGMGRITISWRKDYECFLS